jgi:hypothetical protein
MAALAPTLARRASVHSGFGLDPITPSHRVHLCARRTAPTPFSSLLLSAVFFSRGERYLAPWGMDGIVVLEPALKADAAHGLRRDRD